jgi:hypothetical protein
MDEDTPNGTLKRRLLTGSKLSSSHSNYPAVSISNNRANSAYSKTEVDYFYKLQRYPNTILTNVVQASKNRAHSSKHTASACERILVSQSRLGFWSQRQTGEFGAFHHVSERSSQMESLIHSTVTQQGTVKANNE